MEKLERERAERSHDTTKTKRSEENTIHDKGEACAAFPATAAGGLMGDIGLWSFLGHTCEASLQAILLFLHFASRVMPRRLGSGTLAVVLFPTATCTDLLREARLSDGSWLLS